MLGWLRRFLKKPSPLRVELTNLEHRVLQEDLRLYELEQQFWSDGGVCCPYCGIPGFSGAVDKQVRRKARITQIEHKLYAPLAQSGAERVASNH